MASRRRPTSLVLDLEIANLQNVLRLDRIQLRRLVRTVLTGEKQVQAQISLAFVEDDTIRKIHQRSLGLDAPTDVLTFPLSDRPEILSGEIIVSTQTAQRQARRRRHDSVAETYLYVIHGLLHLCGYDDTTPSARQQMRRRERHYLRLLGLRLRQSPRQ
ncbi:MAG: rRNA maturation RNase YbeY [Gemmatales bacterium]|nr:rRNA maturation RNase YbeY [Gemmatales bacterium]MDW7995604.1 rRNA maturation RNase YbeY [Gemmatales bacterium]